MDETDVAEWKSKANLLFTRANRRIAKVKRNGGRSSVICLIGCAVSCVNLVAMGAAIKEGGITSNVKCQMSNIK